MNRRIVPLLAAALLGAAGGLAGGQATAFAASSGGVSAGPLHWQPSNPATRTYYIPTVSPGSSFSDQMRLQNPNADAVDLTVNAVDGITAIPSGAVYANRTDPVAKWGAWVTPDVSTLTVGAGQSALVGFTVRVPADASPGDHLAGIAFENSRPTPGSGPVNITSIVRTVVGILVQVPGPAVFQLSVGTPTFQPLSVKGLASVAIPVTDTGRLLGRPKLTVTLDGPYGYHRSLTRQLDTILPGDSILYPFPWPDDLAAGAYTVMVTGSADGMSPVSITAHVALNVALSGVPSPSPSAAGPPPANPAPSAVAGLPSWVIPTLVAGGLLLLALITGVWFLLVVLRRQRRRQVAATAAAPVATKSV